jgi:outer membrane protein
MKCMRLLFFWSMLLGVSAWAQEITMGFVADRFDDTAKAERAELIREIEQLAPASMPIRFPETKQIDGGGAPGRIKAGLARLQRDGSVDMIVALGPLAGQIVLAEGAAAKPTVVPVMENAWLFGVSPSDKGSGIRNVNYVIGSTDFGAALKRYREITPFEHAALLVDARTLELSSLRLDAVEKEAGAQGVRIRVVPVEQNGTVQLGTGVQAVLLTDLSGLNAEALKTLLERSNRESRPVFAMGNVPKPGSGILAALTVSDERSRSLRRAALNILAIAQGAPAQRQPVYNEVPSRLTVDMAVARALEISPPFRVLERAQRLHETASDGKTMSLVEVATEALKNNLYLVAGELGVREGKQSVSEVRSVLLPQLGAELRYTQLNRDNVYVESGFYAEKSTDGALTLQQILFSEKALAGLAIQKQLQRSREAQQRGLELEVVRRATTAFLQAHIARTLLDIRRENERLMRANLAMARQRVEAGMTDLSDVYHWESEIAVARQDRLRAEADVARAYERLNRILHRPVTDRYGLREVTLDDPVLLISDAGLLERISNATMFERLNAFYITEAETISPDLDDIDAQLSAQRRQHRSDRRAYWSPDIVLHGELSRVFDETRTPGAAFSLEDETNWQAGVALSLPLFEGGGRSARSSRSSLGVRRLEADRLDRLSALEQRIRGDLHTLRAAYPSIALARSAAKAARKSYVLVRENYAQGNRSLADLLLAQNSALSADFSAVNTRYRFLIELMQLQYDSGRFDFLMDESERSDFTDRLRHALDIPGQLSDKAKGTL